MDVNSKVSFVRNLYQISRDTSSGFVDVEADFTGFPRRKLTLNKQTIAGLTSSSSMLCTGPETCPNDPTLVPCITNTDTGQAAQCTCECSGHHSICDLCISVQVGPCPPIPTIPCLSGAIQCSPPIGGTVGCNDPG